MNSPFHYARLLFGLQFFSCAALLAYGYYLQYVEYLDPCPLCMVQRLFFLLIGLLAAVAAVHNAGKIGRRIYAFFLALLSLLGGAVAGRQIWLQYSPDGEQLECGAGLETMLQTLPLFDVIARVLKGTGDCAIVQWTFAGLSIPEWAAIFFTTLLLTNLYLLLKREAHRYFY